MAVVEVEEAVVEAVVVGEEAHHPEVEVEAVVVGEEVAVVVEEVQIPRMRE